MAKKSSFIPIEGTIYSTPIKKGKRKVDGSAFEIQTVVLEIDGFYEDKSSGALRGKNAFMQFEVTKNVNSKLSLFSVGDFVSASYKHNGNLFKRADGTEGFDNKLLMASLEHADIDSNHIGKITVTPKSTADIEPAPVFDDGDDLNNDPLPF